MNVSFCEIVICDIDKQRQQLVLIDKSFMNSYFWVLECECEKTQNKHFDIQFD